MIRHQAITHDRHLMELSVALQQPKIDIPIRWGEKGISSRIAALGNVMSALWDDDSSKSWHSIEGVEWKEKFS